MPTGKDVQEGEVREEEGERMDMQGVKESEEEGTKEEECVPRLCLLQWDVTVLCAANNKDNAEATVAR